VAKVYSERFLMAAPGTPASAWAPPAGKRAIIRHIAAHSSGPTGDGAFVRCNGAVVWYWASPGPNASTNWEGRVVIYGGELLELYPYGAGFSVIVSGYLFDDDPDAATLPALPEPSPAPPWPLEPPAQPK